MKVTNLHRRGYHCEGDMSLQGVATRAQLLHKWPDVHRLTSQLAYLPPGQTSFIQLGLASLAAKLKVSSSTCPIAAMQTLSRSDVLLSPHEGRLLTRPCPLCKESLYQLPEDGATAARESSGRSCTRWQIAPWYFPLQALRKC